MTDDVGSRLTRVETQVAQLDRHMQQQTEALHQLIRADAARTAAEDALRRAAGVATEAAHERSAWGRALAGWVPWLATLAGWAVLLWVSMEVGGGCGQ